MRAVLFTLLLLCGFGMTFAAPHPAAAQAGPSCGGFMPANVTVTPQFDPVVYEFYQPMLDIFKLANSDGQKIHPENWPVGLETGVLSFQVDSDIFRIRQAKSEVTCGQVKAINVQFGFRDNHIYVAKEFPRRSCPFNTVLGHEEKHAAVDRQLLADFQPRITEYFREAAKNVGVIRNTSADDVEKQITSLINAKIDAISAEIQAERRKRQMEVDSPEEYQRVTISCDGELQQIVNERIALLEETYPELRNHAMPAASATPGPANVEAPTVPKADANAPTVQSIQ